MIRIGLILAIALLGAWSATTTHAQQPTATVEATTTATATGATAATTATAGASAVASPTPFNTPEPGQLIAPAPQPTSPAVIVPQTGFGGASSGDTRLWVGLAALGGLGVISATAGIAARSRSGPRTR